MDDMILYTPLSDEEMEENFKHMDDAACVQASLEQIRAYKNGDESALRIHTVTLPGVDVSAEREQLHLTVREYAAILGVSPRTVEAWESGIGYPNRTVLSLIYLLSRYPSLVPELEAFFATA